MTLQIDNFAFNVRSLNGADDIPALTTLLRTSYRKLGDMGLRFTATWQDDAITARRASDGECYLITIEERLVGTVTLAPPGLAKGCAWFEKSGVASFHQFAVHPDFQGCGLGSAILGFIEKRAVALGAMEFALDTAEPAHHLIRFYERRGFRFVEFVQWETTNYRSVVMSKSLALEIESLYTAP